MSTHLATISWTRSGPDFVKGEYSREHTWTFDGGAIVPASPSPSVVAAPWSNPAHVDPEEAFVASVASCHMLTFLWIASKEGHVVDGYHDTASGVMTRNDRGRLWISAVTLRPVIEWGGTPPPTPEEIRHLHHLAHDECFIANSIATEVKVDEGEPPEDG